MAKARTQKETVAILQKTFPKFNKVAASMAAHPENYGLCFTKKAKKALGEKKKENRKKGHQLTVRVDEDTYQIMQAFCLMKGMTIQHFVESCIKRVTEGEEDG